MPRFTTTRGRLRVTFSPGELATREGVLAAAERVRLKRNLPATTHYWSVVDGIAPLQNALKRIAREMAEETGNEGVTAAEAFYALTRVRPPKRVGTQKLSNTTALSKALRAAYAEHLTLQTYYALTGLRQPRSTLFLDDLAKRPMLFKEAGRIGSERVARIIGQEPPVLTREGALRHWKNMRRALLEEILLMDGWPGTAYSTRVTSAVEDHHGGFAKTYARFTSEHPTLDEAALLIRIIAKNFGNAFQRVESTKETPTLVFVGKTNKRGKKLVAARIGRTLRRKILPQCWTLSFDTTRRREIRLEIDLTKWRAHPTSETPPTIEQLRESIPKPEELVEEAKKSVPGRRRRTQPTKKQDPLIEVYEQTLREREAILQRMPHLSDALTTPPPRTAEIMRRFDGRRIKRAEFIRTLRENGVRVDEPLTRFKLRIALELGLLDAGPEKALRRLVQLLKMAPERGAEYSAPKFAELAATYINVLKNSA